MNAERTVPTYCRICEALCGLEVDVRDGQVTDVRPDPKHPVSKGFACVKGVSLGTLHHDPDRLNHPLRRGPRGFERVRYDEAMGEVGAQLRRIRKQYGPRAVAVYTGNPTFFNYKSFFFAEQLVDALGTPNLFASHSVDCNNKFLVSQLMYGLSTIHPVVDLERVQFLMVLGGNPAVSQMSFLQAPNALSRLKQITRRKGRVIIVDPRRTETARSVGEHVAIRPGTDAHFLLAMAQVIFQEGLFDRTRAERHTRGLARLESVVKEYAPERVAAITGIEASRIRELARAYATAEGAALYMSTGVNMGPFGSIAYWVLQALNVITGNVDRAGGLLQPKGPFDLLRLTHALGVGKRGRSTRDGRFRGVVDALPAGAMAHEILREGEGRIRALIVNAGNPVLSVPDPDLARALASLELLVCIDIYPSETTQLAHYVFPATDMLERSDYPLTTSLNQETPVAQFAERVVPPLGERKEEWEIFCDLVLASRAMAKPTLCHAFGLANRLLARTTRSKLDPDLILRGLLGLGDVSFDTLRKHPHGMLLPPAQPDTFLGKRVYTPDGRVDLAPQAVLDDLPRLERSLLAPLPTEGELVLIGRRDKRSHNSWMHSNPGIQQPQGNRVLIHPEDARARGIGDGALVSLHGAGGEGVLPAELSEDVRRGVVVVPHGWGHGSHGGARARALGGLNVNHVLPGGPDHLEPVSGQAIMVGHPVELRPVMPVPEAQ